MISDLAICRTMGWTYEDLLQLPADVYDVLVEELERDAREREAKE